MASIMPTYIMVPFLKFILINSFTAGVAFYSIQVKPNCSQALVTSSGD